MPLAVCPSTSTKYQYYQISEVESKIGKMEEWGVSPTDPGYLRASRELEAIKARVGLKQPRTFFQIAKAFGMSPGVITLWEDVEAGWMSEARAKPGAPPVYHYVSDEVARAIIKKEVTPEMRKYLFTPDPYLGE